MSVTNYSDINKSLQTHSNIIIVVNSDINTIKKIADKVKETDKLVLVHIDLMKGLKRDSAGVHFLAKHVGVDGIVTTHSNLIKTAKRLSLLTIQRIFILDTASVEQGINSVKESQPSAVEILPGIVLPRIQNKIKNNIKVPIIAAGLINTKSEFDFILQNGAQGISSSSNDLW